MKGIILAAGAGSRLYPRHQAKKDNAPGVFGAKEALAFFGRTKMDLLGMVMC